jgi:hypothetical protein
VKILVIRSEEGKITKEEVVEGELPLITKKYAEEAFAEWDPGSSDFTVLRGKYELRFKLPIDPDLLDVIEELNLDKRIELNELVVEVPLITISFDNEWVGDNYYEKKMYVIVPHLGSEEVMQEIKNYAREATKEAKRLSDFAEPQISLSEEELRRLEEGLEELEKTEKPKKKRRRRKKQ